MNKRTRVLSLAHWISFDTILFLPVSLGNPAHYTVLSLFCETSCCRKYKSKAGQPKSHPHWFASPRLLPVLVFSQEHQHLASIVDLSLLSLADVLMSEHACPSIWNTTACIVQNVQIPSNAKVMFLLEGFGGFLSPCRNTLVLLCTCVIC